MLGTAWSTKGLPARLCTLLGWMGRMGLVML